MKVSILGSDIHVTDYQSAVELIFSWAQKVESRSVYAADVHMLIEANDSKTYQQILNSADLITPDGMPLVWYMRSKGYKNQLRVYGPTLMLKVMEHASKEGVAVGFLGSTEEVLEKLVENMKTKFPGLVIKAAIAPPFHPMTLLEDKALIQQLNEKGVRILFVGLGCPKQEIWIAEHRGKINAVMIGVGAAFNFHAGIVRQAPQWIQKMGFEWLFRLFQEPQRLWHRYTTIVPRYLFLITREWWMEKTGRIKGK